MYHNTHLKSPLNYIGGKYRILPQILPLFPRNIHTFVDLFCGGLDASINVDISSNVESHSKKPIQSYNINYTNIPQIQQDSKSPALQCLAYQSTQTQKIFCNDNLCFLIDLYKTLQGNPLESTLQFLNDTINTYKLDKHNAQGYYILRDEYNTTKAPLLLLALIAFSFNHQVRFNNTHNFNTPFGKNRSSFNPKMRANLIAFIQALQSKDITFLSLDFKEALDSLSLDSQSFVYADPSYLITQGTYNDGKRGFSGWSESLELQLLQSLDRLDSKGMYFALSNVLVHKGRENTILKKWIQSREYTIHNIDSHYTNANYQTKYKDKSLTQEVLITNYKAL